MPRRATQILLLGSLLWLSWLTMMLVHECGHVLGAVCTGGTVRRLVWHPAVLSRTDVAPNPHRLIEVWAGPSAGVLAPLAAAWLASALRLRSAYLFQFVAGFCLVANGAYLGVGAFDPVGDARELIARGTPRWALAAFSAATVPVGLWMWHRVSPRFGFGNDPQPVEPRHAYATFVVAALLTAIGVAFGDRGN